MLRVAARCARAPCRTGWTFRGPVGLARCAVRAAVAFAGACGDTRALLRSSLTRGTELARTQGTRLSN